MPARATGVSYSSRIVQPSLRSEIRLRLVVPGYCGEGTSHSPSQKSNWRFSGEAGYSLRFLLPWALVAGARFVHHRGP